MFATPNARERENVHSNKQKAGQDARICRLTFFFFFSPSWSGNDFLFLLTPRETKSQMLHSVASQHSVALIIVTFFLVFHVFHPLLFYNSLTRPSAIPLSQKTTKKWNGWANWSSPFFFSSSQFLFYLFSFGNGTFKRGTQDKILSLSRLFASFSFFYINKQMIKNAIRKGAWIDDFLENKK